MRRLRWEFLLRDLGNFVAVSNGSLRMAGYGERLSGSRLLLGHEHFSSVGNSWTSPCSPGSPHQWIPIVGRKQLSQFRSHLRTHLFRLQDGSMLPKTQDPPLDLLGVVEPEGCDQTAILLVSQLLANVPL
jgi:hypothetical protein